jgi:23S rRNA pseudouridine1911/1915/1917 synthase
MVKARLETGRTHQLRVHFASIGAAICGDTLYGSESPYISRQALHAAELSFPSPINGERITVVAPVPDDIKVLINSVGLDFEKMGWG